jgi:hypothetical protein
MKHPSKDFQVNDLFNDSNLQNGFQLKEMSYSNLDFFMGRFMHVSSTFILGLDSSKKRS